MDQELGAQDEVVVDTFLELQSEVLVQAPHHNARAADICNGKFSWSCRGPQNLKPHLGVCADIGQGQQNGQGVDPHAVGPGRRLVEVHLMQ